MFSEKGRGGRSGVIRSAAFQLGRLLGSWPSFRSTKLCKSISSQQKVSAVSCNFTVPYCTIFTISTTPLHLTHPGPFLGCPWGSYGLITVLLWFFRIDLMSCFHWRETQYSWNRTSVWWRPAVSAAFEVSTHLLRCCFWTESWCLGSRERNFQRGLKGRLKDDERCLVAAQR